MRHTRHIKPRPRIESKQDEKINLDGIYDRAISEVELLIASLHTDLINHHKTAEHWLDTDEGEQHIAATNIDMFEKSVEVYVRRKIDQELGFDPARVDVPAYIQETQAFRERLHTQLQHINSDNGKADNSADRLMNAIDDIINRHIEPHRRASTPPLP